MRGEARSAGKYLPREEIKGRRTLRDDALKPMNLKNCKYMKGPEFKARQAWLGFVDAVGVALQVMADVKEQTADWFKTWIKDFRTQQAQRKETQQLKFDFLTWIFLTTKEES